MELAGLERRPPGCDLRPVQFAMAESGLVEPSWSRPVQPDSLIAAPADRVLVALGRASLDAVVTAVGFPSEQPEGRPGHESEQPRQELQLGERRERPLG